MKLYGLYSEKQKSLMVVSISANGGDDYVDIEYELETYYSGSNLWTSDCEYAAQRVCDTPDVNWYARTYSTPGWDSGYFGVLTVVDLNEFEL